MAAEALQSWLLAARQDSAVDQSRTSIRRLGESCEEPLSVQAHRHIGRQARLVCRRGQPPPRARCLPDPQNRHACAFVLMFRYQLALSGEQGCCVKGSLGVQHLGVQENKGAEASMGSTGKSAVKLSSEAEQ